MKRYLKCFLIVTLVIIGAMTAVAFRSASGESVVVNSGEVISENYTFTGSNFENNGIIEGNLYAAGSEIIINGEVDGNIFVAGNNITINGKVNGDIYAAGQDIIINGVVAGNVFNAGSILHIGQQAMINHDIFMAGRDIYVNGRVNGDGYLAGSNISVLGFINGDLKYTAKTSNINDGSVNGKILKEEIKEESAGSIILRNTLKTVGFVLTTIVIWAFVTFVINKDNKEKFDRFMTNENILKTVFLYGLVPFILSFIIPFILLITVVLAKLGLFLGLLNMTIIFFSVGIALVVIGNMIGKKLPQLKFGNNILIIVVLSLIVGLIKLIPILSGFVTFPLVVIGYGLILRSIVFKEKLDLEGKN